MWDTFAPQLDVIIRYNTLFLKLDLMKVRL
jgi:hypothetical protein